VADPAPVYSLKETEREERGKKKGGVQTRGKLEVRKGWEGEGKGDEAP